MPQTGMIPLPFHDAISTLTAAGRMCRFRCPTHALFFTWFASTSNPISDWMKSSSPTGPDFLRVSRAGAEPSSPLEQDYSR